MSIESWRKEGGCFAFLFLLISNSSKKTKTRKNRPQQVTWDQSVSFKQYNLFNGIFSLKNILVAFSNFLHNLVASEPMDSILCWFHMILMVTKSLYELIQFSYLSLRSGRFFFLIEGSILVFETREFYVYFLPERIKPRFFLYNLSIYVISFCYV